MRANEIKDLIIKGDAAGTAWGVEEMLAAGLAVDDIIQGILVSAMNVVGERFREGQIFVPEMLIAARAMKAGLKILEPLILQAGRKYLGKVVIGTVKGDLHDIGKNLVGTMLQGAGWDVVDLGVDVAPEKFLKAVKEQKPAAIGLSALLSTTMGSMKTVLGLLEQEGLRSQVKVLVGGAPVSEKYATEIGADGYAPDAGTAVHVFARYAS
ncbi:Cobalamin (vitamin B12)-binding domain protein [Acididesulfobacillus acetoxydans]|uniref:Cobalamin (Vitamin B12)-binding domain protein n=1 Tax=Acididesulfobacillus acetoxydans TaxID=1561005 RepID=A0A8S0X081_9FIRM|nr:corrinoid protein [Acididesulfobacillus acetoxydans]CAA7602431.1 Cobalamin (vitamin B12)-binding domain protein [Acididesulfobacillus acetoxydans]CEJ08334.1 Dimethylamine corrinoid protein 3 [Acididesulfobacillus acetoxydans]